MRFCFDLDGTILDTSNGYDKPILRLEVRELIHKLKSEGHIIIIHTARKMNTHKGNLGKVVADIGSTTMADLDYYDIPYDELYFGKPAADAYIDDKAINAIHFDNIKEKIDGLLNN